MVLLVYFMVILLAWISKQSEFGDLGCLDIAIIGNLPCFVNRHIAMLV
jgi:hypothetical protein